MLCPVPLFPGCRKPVSVAIRTVNGKSGEHVVLDASDVPLDASDKSHTVADEFRDIRGALGSAGSLRKVEDYLYEADFTHLDVAGAETHFRERFGNGSAPGPFGFGCSVVRLGDQVGRAYDWKYDEAVTFVVHTSADGTRFASVAVCPSPAGMTRQAVESLSVPGSLWTALPFYATDGMNEHGVTCSVCVVRAKGDESVLWHGRKFCAVGAVRQVLDRARTAQEGADIIASEAWMPAPDKLGNYSLHFMVTDASHTFVVEDGIVTDVTDDEVKAMTNFRLGSRVFLDEAGHADVNKIASYDPYGTGVERYNELVDYVKSTSEETGMREWLTRLVFSDAYGESPLTGSTPRPSEFAGAEISRDHFAKINETEAIEAWFKSSRVHEKWALRERDGKFWQTVHSAVYDVTARMVSVVVQEGAAVHDFPIVCEGGGSGTVKSVNDVEPDSKTGNVVLTAHDIPYGGEGASNVETAIETNTQAVVDNAEAIDSLEEQVGEIKTTTYTKSEVDDKINQSAAHYLTKRTGTEGHYSYPQFATHADLAAAKAAHTEANPQFFYGVEGHTPDKNDYCVVLADETHDGSTTRYAFVGSWNDNGYFRYQYTINETPFTDEQWAAINSLTSVDEDGNLCFDGIPFINSRGELLFTEDDPVFTAWKNEVQIILGSGANVASGKYKQIAIGAHATANGQNAIAIGSSEPGGRTDGPRAMAQNAVAIGARAVANAVNAIQFLAGTNNTSGTIQVGDKRVAFVSDIPISQADIDDYRYYKGHWDMSVTYKTGDIVRAERTVEGQTEKEVTYFRSLKDNNRANNPFSAPTYWSVTTDDEGLEKLTLFVKAAIQQLTGADIRVSPTDTKNIDESLSSKLDAENGRVPSTEDADILREVDGFSFAAVLTLQYRTGQLSRIVGYVVDSRVPYPQPHIVEIDWTVYEGYSPQYFYVVDGKFYALEMYVPLEDTTKVRVAFIDYDSSAIEGETFYDRQLTTEKQLTIAESVAAHNAGGLTDEAKAALLADKLTDNDLKTLCTTCGISLTMPDGTPKTRAELLIDLFGESNSQLANAIREKVLADGEGGIKAALFSDTDFSAQVKKDANYAVVDTIENRSVKRVTIESSNDINIVIPKPVANGGVVDFEIWFDATAYTGETYPTIYYKYADGTIAPILNKGGDALEYGKDSVTIVHFTSVDDSSYTAVAASFK